MVQRSIFCIAEDILARRQDEPRTNFDGFATCGVADYSKLELDE